MRRPSFALTALFGAALALSACGGEDDTTTAVAAATTVAPPKLTMPWLPKTTVAAPPRTAQRAAPKTTPPAALQLQPTDRAFLAEVNRDEWPGMDTARLITFAKAICTQLQGGGLTPLEMLQLLRDQDPTMDRAMDMMYAASLAYCPDQLKGVN